MADYQGAVDLYGDVFAGRGRQGARGQDQAPASRFARSKAAEETFGAEWDIGKPEDDILVDGSGFDKLYMQSLYGIRSFVAQMKKQGIDVTSPDPSDEDAMEAHELYRTAITEHQTNRKRLMEAKKAQSELLTAYKENKMAGDVQRMGQMYMPGEVPQFAFPTENKIVSDWNAFVADKTPYSADDQKVLENEYQARAMAIDTYVKENNLPAEAAQFYKSRLEAVRPYDAEKRALEDAKTNLSMKATQEQIDLAKRKQAADEADAKADRGLEYARLKAQAAASGGGGGGAKVAGHLAKLVELARGLETPAAKEGRTWNFMAGNAYGEEGAIEGVSRDPEGNLVLSYSKSKTEKASDASEKEVKLFDFQKQTEKGVVALYLEMLPEKERDEAQQALISAGISPVGMTPQEIIRAFGDDFGGGGREKKETKYTPEEAAAKRKEMEGLLLSAFPTLPKDFISSARNMTEEQIVERILSIEPDSIAKKNMEESARLLAKSLKEME